MADRKTYTAEDFKGCNGRRVLVEGVILDGGRPGLMPLISFTAGKQGEAYVPHSAIVEILPDEIGVGDRVRTTGTGECRVLFIYGDDVLVRHDDGSATAWLLSDLTLVERGQ